MRGATRGLVAGVVAAGMALMPAVADATPGSGVTAKILAQTTVGGKDYILREITVAPGGTTGWHFHEGTLYAFVKKGTLTHADFTCAIDGVYKTGAAFTEPSGSNHVHVGRNLGTKPLVLEVLYVDPAGSPLSEDAPNPGCSQLIHSSRYRVQLSGTNPNTGWPQLLTLTLGQPLSMGT